MRTEHLPRTGIWLVLAATSLVAGCGASAPSAQADESSATSATITEYTRELAFLGTQGGEPLAAPFTFRTLDGDSQRARSALGLLARGNTWETFLRNGWVSPEASDPWRIVPHGTLRLSAGGPTDLEALWFRKNGRSLRLDIGGPVSDWFPGRSHRYRILSGRLMIGGEGNDGVILESLNQQPLSSQSPAAKAADWVLLASGDSLHALVVSEADESVVWLSDRDGESNWLLAKIHTLAQKQFQTARREIPVRWSISSPASGLRGQLHSLGYAAQAGAERGGRRAVKVHYTVAGWIEVDGVRADVVGILRHAEG